VKLQSRTRYMAIVVSKILDINILLGLNPPLQLLDDGTVIVFMWDRKSGKYEYNIVDLLEKIRLNLLVIQGLGIDHSKESTTKFIVLSLSI
jgi:hypothetical protein